uniref:RNase III domain-containing protein n=1 Tax=Oryza punctata TaxID=4537 RepID=A0A0E0KLP8_ORYPU
MANLLCLLILVAIPSSRSHALPSSSSPFDAALATLQNQIAYHFHAPDLLRRAMTHASYSRENGRALAVLGLSASQSAAALRALAADRAASASPRSCASPPGPNRPLHPSSAAPSAPSSAPSPSTPTAPTPPRRSSGGFTCPPPHQPKPQCDSQIRLIVTANAAIPSHHTSINLVLSTGSMNCISCF